MHRSKFIVILILMVTLDLRVATAQTTFEQTSSASTVATFRARRDRAMQAAPDALVLVRSQSTIMAENQDGFRQYATFYYLTGLENAVGALLVMDSRRHESWLFVPTPGQLTGFGSFMHSPYAYVE